MVAAPPVSPTLASSMFWAKANQVVFVGLVIAAGCTPQRSATTPGVTSNDADPLNVPADFSLDMVVWADANVAEGRSVGGEEDLRPGRFILFCDGSLHWSDRVDHPEDEMPPLRRILRRSDMAALWTLIRQLGMDETTHATPLVNVALAEPSPDHVVYLVVLTGFGERWAFERRSPAETPPDPAMASLVKRLEELAWADERLAVPAAPPRHDFGPDPYARYRR